MYWRDFKSDPPYDAAQDIANGLETDEEYAWFIYRYKNRPFLDEKRNRFLSYRDCKYLNGVFEGYESHMKTSPYPEDHIEVIAWLPHTLVRNYLFDDFMNS